MKSQERIVEYFLGGLSDKEAERVESECFADEAFAEAAFVIEEDLIDRYVRGELDAGERERFERFYLTTEARRERLELGRALKKEFGSASSIATHESESSAASIRTRGVFAFFRQSSPILRYALGALLLLAVGIGLWQLLRQQNERRFAQTTNEASNIESSTAQPTQTPVPNASTSPTVSAAPTPKSTPAEEPSNSRIEFATAIFTLRPGTLRDPTIGEQVLKLSPQTSTVELRFVLQEDEGKTYRIQIETAEGERILTRPAVRVGSANNQSVLTLRAPASRFLAHDYVARVFDRQGQPAASYVFRIAR